MLVSETVCTQLSQDRALRKWNVN